MPRAVQELLSGTTEDIKGQSLGCVCVEMQTHGLGALMKRLEACAARPGYCCGKLAAQRTCGALAAPAHPRINFSSHRPSSREIMNTTS